MLSERGVRWLFNQTTGDRLETKLVAMAFSFSGSPGARPVRNACVRMISSGTGSA